MQYNFIIIYAMKHHGNYNWRRRQIGRFLKYCVIRIGLYKIFKYHNTMKRLNVKYVTVGYTMHKKISLKLM